MAEKSFEGLHLDSRIDGAAALCHHLDLGAPDRVIQSMDLAVDIGQADVIEIDQRQTADAGPGQGFGGITADPADTEYHDGGLLQTRQPLRPDQEFKAAEAMERTHDHSSFTGKWGRRSGCGMRRMRQAFAVVIRAVSARLQPLSSATRAAINGR